MAAQTPSELLQWLADKQFLPLPQVEELRAVLPSFADRHAFVKELIRRDWLTPFQANQILADKANVLIVEDYRLLERLGEGAMGQVYKAWNVRLGRYVAVKMIHKDHLASAKAMDRFCQEMQAAARLHHPHIVLVRDAGEVNKRPYMVMDYFEGINFSKLIKDRGPLPVHVGCDCIRQAALGLQHAFEHGVVHRDIKPGNLILTRGTEGEPDVVRILDFGLARSVEGDQDTRLTQVGKIIGTIDFISPEQVENAQKADVRSDIYSLGCTLFYLVTGKPPFPGSKFEDKVYARLLGTVPSLRAVRSEVPAALDNVLDRTMARDPAERFQTPAELAQALEPFCDPLLGKGAAASVPLAQPVAPPAQLPLAQPVFAAAPPVAAPQQPAFAEPAQANLFGFDEQAEPSDCAFTASPPFTEAAAAASPDAEAAGFANRRKSPSRKLRTVGLMGGIFAVVLLVLIGSWWLRGKWSSGKKLVYPGGSLRIVPPAAVKLKDGGKKIIIVKVERKGFQGPVKLQFKDLPEDFASTEVTIPDHKDKGEISFTFSYGLPKEYNLKLTAKAEELEAEEILAVTVAKTSK